MKTKNYTTRLFTFLIFVTLVNPFSGISQSLRSTHHNNSEFIPGTIVIKVKEGIGPYEKQERSIAFGIPSLDEKSQKFAISKLEKRFHHKPIPKNSGLPDLSRIYRIKFPETQDVHQVAMEFANDPNIEYAEAVPIYRAADVPNDPMYNFQQHLPQIMASEAWDVHKGEDGDEVIVAIIDTGVDWLHEDLTENCWQNLGEDADGDGVTLEYNNGVWERDPGDMNGIDDDGNGFIDDVIGWDFHEDVTIGDGSNPDPIWGGDLFEHGSHCAGIAAGSTNNGVGISSVSHNVTYMAVQVDNGNDQFTYAWDAIIYAADNGAHIISNSWGGPNYSEVGRETIEYAVGMGSIVVVAAHNFNTDTKYYPAAYQGAVSVSALNPDDTRASFTNYGAWLDVAAPGVSILSTLTNNNYASWNGTSMATPMVAGLFALLKSYQPDWTNDQLIEQIIGTADNIDTLNPGYEKALGSGRINAYHALVDDSVQVPQELKLEFISSSFEDKDGDGILEAGETCTISFSMRNYAHLVNDENTSFVISSPDPDISITVGSVTESIPADGVFEVIDAFEFVIEENAKAHLADFVLEVISDKEITYGAETEFATIISSSGFFVWEGEANGEDFSGTYIRDFLEERGYDVFYSTTYPESFTGFDAVFLSFGGSSDNSNDGIVFLESHSIIIQQYLEQGGTLYVEGSPFFFQSEYWPYQNHDEFVNLFGISSGWGEFIQNPISKLTSIEGTIHEGMTFNSSTQTNYWYIDKIIPNEGAIVSFSEEDYGNVSVYNEGEFGQKTFYFSYSLAELVDENPHSSRYNVLVKVMDFFGYPDNDGLIANFSADKTEGKPDLLVQFTDWSITEDDLEITAWAWDFNEDGEYDAFDQNPSWTYTSGGVYDVSLVIYGDGGEIDTLVREDFITIRQGILVYEGKENANGYSGTYIRDYLVNHGYDYIGYTNSLPANLEGYDAVFLSFGNTGLRSTPITDAEVESIYNYTIGGGKIYIEGGDVMNSFGPSNWVFGLQSVEGGDKNLLLDLTGQVDALTNGMQFQGTDQLSQRSIDKYEKNSALPGSRIAFVEGEYGSTAIEFDGSSINGQKTFCMSYGLADLVDGDGINTRDELLQRILNFFDVVTDVDKVVVTGGDQLKVFPNPTSNELSISGLPVDSDIQLTDLSGNLLLTKKAKGERITLNISELPKGLYILRTDSGVMKIVKM